MRNNDKEYAARIDLARENHKDLESLLVSGLECIDLDIPLVSSHYTIVDTFSTLVVISAQFRIRNLHKHDE